MQPLAFHKNRLTLAVSLVTLLAAQSQAQSGDGNGALALEEVMVTAELRSENLQEVPVAVTAFTADEIVSRGIESTADFVALTPNVTFDDSFTVGNSFVAVRGVTQINNADSPVAIVVDGVPQNNQKQFKMELYDVERIEVLKGPQGALYGRNAIGGAVNIVTKAPTNELEGYVTAGAGNGGLQRIQGALSGPIIEDELLFRVAGSYRESDGLIDNTFLNTEVDFVESYDLRGRLQWFPTEALVIDFRLATSELEGGAVYDAAFIDGASPDNTNQERSPITDILGDSDRSIDEVTVKIDYTVDAGTFTYIGGYTDIAEDYYGDLDFCNPVDCPDGFFGFGQVDQAQDLDVELLSHEFRFTSASDQRLRYTAGLFYIDTDRSLGTVATLTQAGNFPIVQSLEDNDNTAWAVFAQFDYDITDALELTLSLRYDEDEREQTDVNTGASREASYDEWQPKATLTWTPAEDQLFYATYARGFRSGGFNGVGGREFLPETVDNFELGYKSTWMDDRLLFNAAAYRAESNDFQFFYVDFNAGGAQVIDNLDEVLLTGVELEVKYIATKNLSFYVSAGFQDSDIESLNPELGVPAEEGNKSPRTTEHTINIGGLYETALSSSLNGFVRIDYERRGDRYWHPDNVDVMDPIDLLGARIGISGDQWSITAWGRNLTDEFFYEDFTAQAFSGLPWNIGFATRPRSYGLDLRYDF